MVKAADTWDFESKIKVLEHEHDTECNEWKAQCNLKLKQVVVSARQQFKWQSTGADATLKEKPLAEWLARRLPLLGHCTGKSAVMPAPASKRCMSASTTRHVWDCADVKTSANFEKGVCRGILNTVTTWAVYLFLKSVL